MTRRNPSQYNWDALEFDETILPADPPRYNSPRQAGIEFVVLHHMTVLGNGDGGALDTCVNIWRTREASAQYGVDGGQVRQFVWDNDAAWATANWDGNHRGVSIEHANSAVGDASGWPVAESTWRTGARLTAYLHKTYGLGRPWTKGGMAGTVRVHQCFFATGCPGPFMMANLDNYVAEAARVYDAITGGKVQAAAGPTVTPIQEDDMPLSDADVEKVAKRAAELTWLYDYKVSGRPGKPLWILQSLDGIVANVVKQTVDGVTAPILKAVASVPGVDPAQVKAALADAAAQIKVNIDTQAIAKQAADELGKRVSNG